MKRVPFLSNPLEHFLCEKPNYDVLTEFLTMLLDTFITLKSIDASESNKEDAKENNNLIDVFVEKESGEIMLIKLLVTLDVDDLRSLPYSLNKAYAESVIHGGEVSKVYFVNFMYADIGQGSDSVYHGGVNFTGLHKNDKLQLSESQCKQFGKKTFSDSYPEYYILNFRDMDDKTKPRLEKWINFLKNSPLENDL